MKAIEFKNVSFFYSNANEKILDKINFSIEYGELVLLTGYSGSGKSTIFNLINGIIPNSITGKIAGEILINGESNKYKKIGEISQHVGSVLQNADNQIVKEFIKDEIAFGCENFAVDPIEIEKRVKSLIKDFKLDDSVRTDNLSGGQKQMVVVATTLAMQQKIIILDEPLANLDKDGSLVLMNVLKRLTQQGYAILIVEHRIDVVIPFVDKIIEIENKNIKQIDNYCEYLLNKAKKIEDTSNVNPTNEVIIDIKKLNFSYGKKTVLKDVTLDIKKGERVVILGENGCGKTTLIKIIARLLKGYKGAISININGSKNKGLLTRKWFQKVGFVFQNPNYQLFMPSVLDELKYGANKNSFGVQEMINTFNLEKTLKIHPQSLSEGQKRKVSIAAIMVSNPNLLILDEPTVGQDYEGLRSLCDKINRIHNETNNTIITITHDFRCAKAICDKTIIINNGKVEKIGGKELIDEYFLKNVKKQDRDTSKNEVKLFVESHSRNF